MLQNNNYFTKRTYYPRKHVAFTLAEVLITLGIIGVVAALTLPTLIAHNKKQTTSAKIKKVYSTISQALIRAQVDNEGIENWDYASFSNDKVEDRKNASEKFAEKFLKPYLNAIGYDKNAKFKISNQQFSWPRIDLADGTQIFVNTGACYDIYVDINGNDKAPNEGGRDIFVFLLCNANKGGNQYNQPRFSAYGHSVTASRNTLKSFCASTTETLHQFCTGLLQCDNWEFKDDYPFRL